MAPEVLAGEYNNLCDIWSMGVILYLLVSGNVPFPGDTDPEVFKRIEEGHYDFDDPIWETISAECKDLITKMLAPQSTRLTPQQVLSHPWITKCSIPNTIALPPTLLIKNLQTFCAATKIKKAVISFIATQLAEDEYKPLKKMFLFMDQNGDGLLSIEEISESFKGKECEENLIKAIKGLDTDHSGFIDYNGNFYFSEKMRNLEFLAAAMNEEAYLAKDKLRLSFNAFDKVKNIIKYIS